MTTLIGGGVILALGALALWLLVRQARKQGAADAIRQGEEDARDVEQDMADDIVQDRDIDDVLDNIKDGKL